LQSIDGNKRTALASMIVFLGLNGIDLEAPRKDAAGEITGDVLAGWIAVPTAPFLAAELSPDASICA
jgi:prophage maintenance system killer protein